VEGITRYPTDGFDQGWSYDNDLTGQLQSYDRTGMHASKFSQARVWSLKMADTPNAGYVLVEINYYYHQVLALPWFTQFVSDPITFNLYAMWPCESAEPIPTLKPPPIP
jgi:hypothetical protein